MPSSAGLEFDTIFTSTAANSGFSGNLSSAMQTPLGEDELTLFSQSGSHLYLRVI